MVDPEVMKTISALLVSSSWEQAANSIRGDLGELHLLMQHLAETMSKKPDIDELLLTQVEQYSALLQQCSETKSVAPFQAQSTLHWVTVRKKFQADIVGARSRFEQFQLSGQKQFIDAAEACWERVRRDVDFPNVPLGFQLFVLDGVVSAHLARHYAFGSVDDLESAIATLACDG